MAASPFGAASFSAGRYLWLDTFDRLSAPLEARYTWEDLAPWFERAGLAVDAVRDDAGLFITAHRPA